MIKRARNGAFGHGWLTGLVAVICLSLPATATSSPNGSGGAPALFGLWRNPAGSVTIRINACGDQVCGTVATANAEATADARDSGYPNLQGMTLMRGTIAPRSQTWHGSVLVPDLGRSFDAHIEMTDGTHAKVTGCLWRGLFCRSQTWMRL